MSPENINPRQNAIDETKQYEGKVKILANGVGFMENEEIKQTLGLDTFIDKNDVTSLGLQPGDTILSWVRVNDKGKPQAFEVQVLATSEEKLPLIGGCCVASDSFFHMGGFEGVLKILQNGVGFLTNPEVKAVQGKDIFIDRKDVDYYKLVHGDTIRCQVYINKEKKPQGFELEVLGQMLCQRPTTLAKKNDNQILQPPAPQYNQILQPPTIAIAGTTPYTMQLHQLQQQPIQQQILQIGHVNGALHTQNLGLGVNGNIQQMQNNSTFMNMNHMSHTNMNLMNHMNGNGNIVNVDTEQNQQHDRGSFNLNYSGNNCSSSSRTEKFGKMQQLIEWLGAGIVTEKEFSQMKSDLLSNR